MNYKPDINLSAWQLSASQSSCLCACPCWLLCIISTRRKGDVVSSAILRPQTLQEVMSGSRLTPWTEDAPCQSCSGLALTTWKISGSQKILLEAGSLRGYSHGDAPRFLVSSGAENFAWRQMSSGQPVKAEDLDKWEGSSVTIQIACFVVKPEWDLNACVCLAAHFALMSSFAYSFIWSTLLTNIWLQFTIPDSY